MSHRSLVTLAILVLTLCAGQAALGQWVQWPESEGGNGHWYRFSSVGTWADVRDEAIAAGGYLVTIDEADEDTFIYEQFVQFNDAPVICVWTGFNDIVEEGTWTWVGDPEFCSWNVSTGGTCYTNWAAGEPNDDPPLGGEDCGCMWDARTSDLAGHWNDYPCVYDMLKGIIEVDHIPDEVPTLSEWAAVSMTLLLLVAGTVVFGRMRNRRPAVA